MLGGLIKALSEVTFYDGGQLYSASVGTDFRCPHIKHCFHDGEGKVREIGKAALSQNTN